MANRPQPSRNLSSVLVCAGQCEPILSVAVAHFAPIVRVLSVGQSVFVVRLSHNLPSSSQLAECVWLCLLLAQLHNWPIGQEEVSPVRQAMGGRVWSTPPTGLEPAKASTCRRPRRLHLHASSPAGGCRADGETSFTQPQPQPPPSPWAHRLTEALQVRATGLG
ncbi:unnamed protein product [Protopolystoma xenopodis]|uniref:Uncharacterized protein n=1 Tax=Protopolystoma xenopodis TaxID=117903 RepID=A0A3S5BE42_9PLAT|nr:unnamed protein product [Protopolystoma xenopodis]